MKHLATLCLLFALAACAGPQPQFAFKPGDGVVTLVTQRTNERATIRFREAGFVMPAAIKQADYLMRDVRTGMVGSTDPNLLIFLDDLTATLGLPGNVPVIVTSGYRSPMTNNGLRQASGKVAENSYHLYGQALDFKIPDMDGRTIAQVAQQMRRGGVAYYANTGHVHIDTGPVRTWKTQ